MKELETMAKKRTTETSNPKPLKLPVEGKSSDFDLLSELEKERQENEGSDLHWYDFFNQAGWRPLKQDRHWVQWDESACDRPEMVPCSLNDGCMEARVYCPTCDKYLCLVHHYLIHLTEGVLPEPTREVQA